MFNSEGGFIVEEANPSQNWAGSPSKTRLSQQKLTPVTIQQLINASPGDGDWFNIDLAAGNQEITQVVLVACIRAVKDIASGHECSLEDGTGTINSKFWNTAHGSSSPPQIGQWVKVFGGLKTFKDTKFLNVFSFEPIKDFNVVTMHFLQVLKLTMSRSFDMDCLNPIQRAVLTIYSKSDVPRGVHQQSVIRSLSHVYPPDEIRNTISWLTAEGYIFETHDSDHAKLVA